MMAVATAIASVVPFFLAMVTLLALFGLVYYRPRRHIWAMAKSIPGPKVVPFVGNGALFWGGHSETLNTLLRLFEKHGPLVRLWLGDRLLVLMIDPEDIQMVLGNARIRNRDSNISKAMIPFFGNGLLSNQDEIWRTHRKIITPTFHFKILESYVEIFGQKTEVLVHKLNDLADGRTVNIYKYLTLCTLDAICETAIGAYMNSQDDGFSDFQNLLDDATELVHNRAIKPWLLVDWLYPLTTDGKKAAPLVERIKKFSESIITQKLAEYRSGVRRAGIVTSSGKTITSFLDMLIEASETQGSILSAEEMQDEVTTMAAAGLETTASSMSFLMILVAIHPEIQDQLYEELMEVFGDDPRAATPEDIQQLPVMDRVIKETLRHFPIVTLLPREISEDITLPSGHTLPKGSSSMVMSYAVHRNPKYFVDPLKFWPDRWLPENSTNRHPYAYLPFSAGPRNCVGQKYAMFQMKTILSTILRRFKVRTDYKMEDLNRLEMSITITIGPGKYLVQLEKR